MTAVSSVVARRRYSVRLAAVLAAMSLTAAACASGSDEAEPSGADSVADETGTTDETAPDDSGSDTVAPDDTVATDLDTVAPDDTVDTVAPDDSSPTDASDGIAALDPPTGEPIVIGMVNTEGTPGLDFPEMRTDTDLAVNYLNEHGGMGGRPIQIEHCAAAGSPETSQACAQELSGKGVEFVMLGLDLFPGYDTFAASDIPVFGALPILPPDYTADALFLTGGNATTMAAMVALAVEKYGAESVGIISADNAGANGSEAALIGALDKVGIPYVSIKGGDNETDAGFQGLLREANAGSPDILMSLYADAGCIGVMRGRVQLGIETPMVSTAICGSSEVLDVVGDDAVGWSFVGIGAPTDTPAADAFEAMLEPEYGDLESATLGLGALGITQVVTLARVANAVAAEGGEVNGQSIQDRLRTATDLASFPNDSPLACGLAENYPSVCSFEFPIGEYLAGGEVETIPGFESVSVVDYLP